MLKGVVTTPILAAVLVEMVTRSPGAAAAAFFVVIVFAIAVMSARVRHRG